MALVTIIAMNIIPGYKTFSTKDLQEQAGLEVHEHIETHTQT